MSLHGPPFFETYIHTFENPALPTELENGNRLRLHLVVQQLGSNYLPQAFDFDLPRSLDPGHEDTIFHPRHIRLFRTPASPLQNGWAVIRLRVVQTNTEVALPGVLVRIFRAPRGEDGQPIAEGMTEWRGRIRGEAIIGVAGIQRFRPNTGEGENVMEVAQAVDVELVRHTSFVGDIDQFPNPTGLVAGLASENVSEGLQVTQYDAPWSIRASQEITQSLEMP